MRKCTKCGLTKSLDAFNKRKKDPEGRTRWCRDCHNEWLAGWRDRNRERLRAQDNARRAADVERYRAKGRANGRARREADPQAHRDRLRQRYWADPEGTRERARDWRKANPDLWSAIMRAASHKRKARLGGTFVAKFTNDQLMARMAYWGNKCYMCFGAWNAVEHVKPISVGGSHCLANLRPACKSCNSSKRNEWRGPQWAMRLVGSRVGRHWTSVLDAA